MPTRLRRLLYDAYCQIQSPSPYSPHTTSPSIHPLLSTRALTVVSREPSRLTLSPTTAVTSRSSFSNASMSVETGTRRRLWRLLQMWTGAQTKGTGCSTNPEGTRWDSSCWYTYNLRRYESPLQFDITLDDKTDKMYCGGKICLTVHFKLLWAKNCLWFGLAHALCLGLAPWLAAEVPILDDEAAPVNATAAFGSAAAS